MALIVGFACAYPINWWLVANHMKHGMLTVPQEPEPTRMGEDDGCDVRRYVGSAPARRMSTIELGRRNAVMASCWTFAILGAALVIVVQFAQ